MRRAVFGTLLLLATASRSQPSISAPIIQLASRNTIRLDGMWNTIVDPYEVGLEMHFFENAKPKSKGDLIEYDFDRSPQLRVPGDWNTQRPSLLFYEGPIWYQRYFSYSPRRHGRLFLYFGAANYQASVWLNGRKLGEHRGGFTPFNFEITQQIAEHENSLVVEVDNTRRREGVPAPHTDWWNYGGLTRSVRIVEVPETFIEDYSLHLAPGIRGQAIEGWVQFNGRLSRHEVRVQIPEAKIDFRDPISGSGRANILFALKPGACGPRPTAGCPTSIERWSPDNPKLYQVVISGEGDTVTDEIGFRTLETHGSQIHLNGKPIFLRGISLHEEAAFRGGRAFSEEDDRILLTWAKELGCNFVRLAHYPHNEEMMHLADRMGLAIWEEVPVYWGLAWQDTATLENAKSQLQEVISRDRNRASVLFWSLSNETPQEPGRLEFLRALASYARQLDSTRLITSATNHTKATDPDNRSLNDPLSEILDVLGLNEYLGWYEGRVEDMHKMRWQNPYGKPLIVSEFGAGAVYGLHGDTMTRFSEEYQANLYQEQIAMLARIPSLAGMSPWLLMDFRSPRRPLAGIQDYYNRKGLISDRGQRKQAFFVLQKFYREKAQKEGSTAAQP